MDTRLILDAAGEGSWNMAVDEALLLGVGQGNPACLRFYQWSQPTLSLGYFQAAAHRDTHPSSRELAVVRRSTGGGAIVHDRELTYSFVVPVADARSRQVEAYYRRFHQELAEVLSSWGISASVYPGTTQRQRDSAFLCFQRRSTGDLVVGDVKVAGSAQRRHRGAVLQHGSVLLESSPWAPELLGIREVSGCTIEAQDVACKWGKRLADALGLRLTQRGLLPEEEAHAQDYQKERFGASCWTCRR